FVEPVTVASIADIRAKYETSGLKERLARYHVRVNDAFLGWADIWLDPRFRAWSIEDVIPDITAPLLLIQGKQDEYGTLAQIDRIETLAKA
ncbi:hypothetical protein, partial [Shewanella algae]|uniref:hypothetical protein n=1 Tax=Shewanella algae TaxID=38313 RepID=UPI00313CA6F5